MRLPGARGAGRADPPGHGQEAGRALRLGAGDGRAPCGSAARVAAAGAPGVAREAFVGRQAELAWLEERFAAAVAGAGSVVFVTGERGVGKSTLVGEFLRRVRTGAIPVTLVAGRCSEAQGPGEAFLPFLDAVGRLLTSRGRDQASELLRTYAPTICVQMPAGLLPDPDGSLHRQTAGATKERLIREAGDFMEAAGRGVPDRLLPRGPAVGGRGQRGHAASPGLPPRPAADAHRRDVPAGRRGRGQPPAEALRRSTCWPRGAARELALGALTEDDLGAYLEARFPGHRFPPALARRAARAHRGAAALRAEPGGHPRRAGGRRPGRRGMDARPSGRGSWTSSPPRGCRTWCGSSWRGWPGRSGRSSRWRASPAASS